MRMCTVLIVVSCMSLLGCNNGKDVSRTDKAKGSQESSQAEEARAASDKAPAEGVDEAKEPPVDGGPDAAVPAAPVSVTRETGNLQVQWIHGAANCNQNANPPLQVHAYNKNLIILRQNKCLNFEAPFIYLIFGQQKALLLDTGATASASTFPIRQTVENLMLEHYGAERRAQIQLLVAHSHAHGNHRAADAQFNGQAITTLIGTTQAAVAAFFAISDWPNQIVDYDLGERILQIIPIPGHETG